jgi:hypothetical protein
MRDSRSHAAMASRYHPERQRFLSPPTPPATPPSSSKMTCPFPSITSTKGEVKSYIRALLATYPPNNQNQRQGHSFDSSAGKGKGKEREKPAGGLSTLPSFRSIRSLALMTPIHAATCKIWFDGAYLRLLLHVGSLRRELRLLGFEDGVASWLDREMQNRFKGMELKGQVRFILFASFEIEEEGSEGC